MAIFSLFSKYAAELFENVPRVWFLALCTRIILVPTG